MKPSSKYISGFVLLSLAFGFTGCAFDNHVKVLSSNDAGTSQTADQSGWHEVQKGLSYDNVLVDLADGSRKEFFLAKVDPDLFEFRVYNNTDQAKAKTLKEIHQQEGSVLTFNGAFFDEKFKAMGLLQDAKSIYHKQIASDLMNGVFEIPNINGKGSAKVYPLEKTPKNKESFMIQNGPVLIDENGFIPLTKDTEKLAARTALGADNEGNVVLIVLHQSLLNTDNTVSLYQFAHLLKENALFAPMGLHSILNLDGGPSTGVIVGAEYLPEPNNVQNAVITLPRT